MVEGNVERNSFDVSVGLPDEFESGVEVLGNGIWNCVPEADGLDESIAESIVAERKGDAENRHHVGTVHADVKVVDCSHNCRNFFTVSEEDLVGTKH